MSTLGKRLKQTRTGFSQKAVADKFGLPQTTWSNYEQGKNKPDFALLDKVCLEFGVNADWLIFGRGPRHGKPVDLDRLARAIGAVERGLEETGKKMEPERKAEMTAAVYDLLNDDVMPEPARIIRLIRTMA